MNIKKWLVFGCAVSCVSLFGDNVTQLTEAVAEVVRNRNWKSSRAVQVLEDVAHKSTNQEEQRTAQILLYQCLVERAEDFTTADEETKMYAQLRKLREEVLARGANSWQGLMAKYGEITEQGMMGNKREQIRLTREALNNWDFKLVEEKKAPALDAMLTTTDGKPRQLREMLKLILTNALCAELRVEEAKEVWRTMHDPDLKKIMSERIGLAERDRGEIEARRMKRK